MDDMFDKTLRLKCGHAAGAARNPTFTPSLTSVSAPRYVHGVRANTSIHRRRRQRDREEIAPVRGERPEYQSAAER
jgi:hypothetical protein